MFKLMRSGCRFVFLLYFFSLSPTDTSSCFFCFFFLILPQTHARSRKTYMPNNYETQFGVLGGRLKQTQQAVELLTVNGKSKSKEQKAGGAGEDIGSVHRCFCSKVERKSAVQYSSVHRRPGCLGRRSAVAALRFRVAPLNNSFHSKPPDGRVHAQKINLVTHKV